MKLIWIRRLILFLIAILPIASVYADTDSFSEKLAEIEHQADGRIGVYAINTANNQKLQYRADERFPFCSTGKIMVVSAILKASENNPHLLRQKIIYTPENLQQSSYTPITEKWVKGMSVTKLGREDALQPSQRGLLLNWLKNNTAGNLKIRAGVPKGWVVGDKKSLANLPFQNFTVATGYLKVATPELITLDLLNYPNRVGGLNHIATVLRELF